MGRPGGAPARKAPGTALSPRNGQRAVLVDPGERFELPEDNSRPFIGKGPDAWHRRALEAWDEYWNDPVSGIYTEADKSLLKRWIDSVNRYYWLVEEADLEPVVFSGANGRQPNPLYKVTCNLANQIERMELKLGIGPRNRLSLGIQILEGEQAQQRVQRGRGGAPPLPELDEEDPRLT